MAAVERHAGAKVAQAGRQKMHHAAPVTEAHCAEFAAALGAALQNLGGGHEVLACLRLIEGPKQGPGLFFVTWIPAERG